MTAQDIDPSQWIRRYTRSEQAKTRLICFPHAGGSASFYHPVAMKFAPEIDVVALQYPGRQDRRKEPLITDINTYADHLTTVIKSMPEAPTVFFGHSMGAVLAFEVAHRLEQRSPSARLSIIASGRRAPSTTRDEKVHLRDDAGLISELKQLNGTGVALFGDDEILRMALPAIRGDYEAIETYDCRPGLRVRAPITVLIGDDDPKSTVDEADRWREHTSGAFRLRTFSGGHFYLTGHQTAVNQEITTELAAISPAPGRSQP